MRSLEGEKVKDQQRGEEMAGKAEIDDNSKCKYLLSAIFLFS